MRKILIFVAISVVAYFGVAFGLVLSQWPKPETSAAGSLAFERLGNSGIADFPAMQTFEAGDGTKLNYRRFDGGSGNLPLLVLVHGSGWHGGAYLPLAAAIAHAGAADVVVPDLRGHGPDPVRRGDVDYIGQLEDDLADLIEAARKPGQEIVLAGHSSGGGLVVRFAGGPHGEMMDRAILLAPYLHHEAPTVRPNAGGWARPLIRRIIGLTMLNRVGVNQLNGLTIVEFAFPRDLLESPRGNEATTAYSYRLNRSFAPRDGYLSDIAALPPFLLIAGLEDEAFRAREYAPVMSDVNSKGRYLLLENVSHLEVYSPENAAAPMIEFLERQ